MLIRSDSRMVLMEAMSVSIVVLAMIITYVC
nr:MAG TPA: hypothetical protein [Caudoviricetes sp.]